MNINLHPTKNAVQVRPTKNKVVVRVAKTETLISYVSPAQAEIIKSEVL